MDAIEQWTRDVLDALERRAREAGAGEWTAVLYGEHLANPPDWGEVADASGGLLMSPEHNPADGPVVRHVALHDPRAVLARVEAERAVLVELDGLERTETLTAQHAARVMRRQIAHGHRHDAPGWREEWAPPV